MHSSQINRHAEPLQCRACTSRSNLKSGLCPTCRAWARFLVNAESNPAAFPVFDGHAYQRVDASTPGSKYLQFRLISEVKEGGHYIELGRIAYPWDTAIADNAINLIIPDFHFEIETANPKEIGYFIKDLRLIFPGTEIVRQQRVSHFGAPATFKLKIKLPNPEALEVAKRLYAEKFQAVAA